MHRCWAGENLILVINLKVRRRTDLPQGRKSIEEPTVTVGLLLVLLFHAEDYPRGYDSFIRVHEPKVGIESERSGVRTSDPVLCVKSPC